LFPVLIRINNFPIHTYGVLIAVGFLLGVWFAKKEAKRLHLPPDRVVDLSFWALLVGMFGSRLLFVVTQLSYFAEHPLEIFHVWEGGLVFYGGLITCMPFFYWFCRKYKMPIAKVLDLGSISLPLAHAFGRLGCFSAGCCYGKPTGMPWGVSFDSQLVDISMRGIPLHPTQLYEAGALFLLFAFLYRHRVHKKFSGELALLYCVGYSAIRFIIEFFRGDLVRGFVVEGVLSTSQFIALLVFLAGLVFYVLKRKEGRAK
jgi:phosphatidylglycerol:prolipoprotein diacylglycerol transferase